MKLSDLAEVRAIDDPRLDHPVYDTMDNATRVGAMLAASRLMACAGKGFGELLDAKRIIDFGTGDGASAFSLGLLAEQTGGSVDSLELNTSFDWAEKIKQSGLMQHLTVHVYDVDGLEWISSRAQEGERYDLIAGFWFAPDNAIARARDLISVSRQALASHGLLMIYSDAETMESLYNGGGEESGGIWIRGRQNAGRYEPTTVLMPRVLL